MLGGGYGSLYRISINPSDHLASFSNGADIGEPFLFGFQPSLNAFDDFTQGPLQDQKHYRHHLPDYISVEDHRFKRFIQPYDWCSLGILLLKIGF